MLKIWNRLFLVERPSISFSLFRIVVALTVGFYVFPTFVHFKQNYLTGAFKTFNAQLLTVDFIEIVQKSPDWLAVIFLCAFCIFWIFFFIGLFSQLSCIVVMVCCYYFTALNYFHLASLSWDILLVTMFLMCVTNYHSDYFSIDALRRKDIDAYDRRRPFFIQRLLQLQVGFTFFYTACYKITAEGNWLTGNPIYNLMHYPPQGVVKNFLLKDFLYDKPNLCFAIGIFIVLTEILLIFVLFARKTRMSAIYLGIIFHFMLLLTLDVPAVFFFLFPPMLLLFVNPDNIVAWIQQKRIENSKGIKPKVLYDGKCQFCISSVKKLQVMDLFGVLDCVDFQSVTDFKQIHPDLTREKLLSQMYFISRDRKLFGGFFAFRRLSLLLPMMYPCILIFYFPGMGLVGSVAYRFVAQKRYLFHIKKKCKTNSCYR